MRTWDPARVAAVAGAQLHGEAPGGGPVRAVIDSREAGPGDLFVGLRGSRDDGGVYAQRALDAGAWGVLASPEYAEAATGAGVRLAAADPLGALQALARAWRRELGARVIAVTGSTGKTSTKDIVGGLLTPHLRTVVSPLNHNTEIGLPLTVLGAPADTEALVLEMGMRGSGQIAELAAIAEPDVGVIVSVGPVHLELLGSLEAVAAAKAELIAGLAPGRVAVVPAREPLLASHLRDDVPTVRFGPGGDVTLLGIDDDGTVRIATPTGPLALRPSFTAAHQREWNLLAAVAAVGAIGVRPDGDLDVVFSAGRGERFALTGGLTLVDDCYNANPMSMRAALQDLADTPAGRRVAVLGDMLELGPDAPAFHAEIGACAGAAGVALLVTVGPLAAEMARGFDGATVTLADAAEAAAELPALLHDGDTVLVKGSRGVGLSRVVDALRADRDPGAVAGAANGTS
jgi:UDP-N-acetylmuramoyl-tripeptide--D-alanyl-D-alanine ligase